MVHSCKVIQKLGSQERPEALVSKSRICDATFHGKSCPAAAWQDGTEATSTVCSVGLLQIYRAQGVIENLVAASSFFGFWALEHPALSSYVQDIPQSFYMAILHPFIPFIHTSRQGRD